MGMSLLFSRTFGDEPFRFRLGDGRADQKGVNVIALCSAQRSSPLIDFVHRISGTLQNESSDDHQVWIVTHGEYAGCHWSLRHLHSILHQTALLDARDNSDYTLRFPSATSTRRLFSSFGKPEYADLHRRCRSGEVNFFRTLRPIAPNFVRSGTHRLGPHETCVEYPMETRQALITALEAASLNRK